MEIKSPSERQNKLILVSIVTKHGVQSWGLLPATKVGNYYKISIDYYNKLVEKTNTPF